MAYEPIVLGSNITGMGALPPPPNYYTSPEAEERTAVVTNEDGTITVPKYKLAVNKPTFDLQNMQDLYGTKYMPMFRWISQRQTGTVTFDPDEGQISAEEVARLSADFTSETGMSADEALKAEQKAMLKAAGKETLIEVAKGIGGQIGYATAAAGGSLPGSIAKGTETYFKYDNPFELIGKNRKGDATDLLINSPESLSGIQNAKLATLNKIIADGKISTAAAIKDPSGSVVLEKAAAQARIDKAALEASGGNNIVDGFKDRANTGLIDGKGSAAGKSNLYGSAGAGIATFAAAMIAGESARDAAKRGLGVTVGTFVGNLLPIGPLGGFIGGTIGGMLGGRVICNELMRQGLLTRSEVLLDYRFTRDYLTPTHVNGYHVWAVWMVKQMRKGRFVGFWKHVAGHRANEIAYIYGDRDKPDYLGKAYRKILEPICWSIGFFCKTTDWTVLYKKKEI